MGILELVRPYEIENLLERFYNIVKLHNEKKTPREISESLDISEEMVIDVLKGLKLK